MATNKEELALEIDFILSQTAGEITSMDQAVQARKRLATALAGKIDAYVQQQIGTRLEGILTALGALGTDGSVVPLVRGPAFGTLTRKT